MHSPTCLDTDIIGGIRDAVVKANISLCVDLVNQAIEQGVDVRLLLNKALISGMEIVGAAFKENQIFIPEVMLSAKAMQAGVAALEPQLIKAGVKPLCTIVIGTVKGDLHDIGKNLVVMMLKGAGFRVEDLGIDVSAERFVQAVHKHKPIILGMSCLLTTSMSEMDKVIGRLQEEGLASQIKTLVGGAPVDQDYARRIGADGYAQDAARAVDVAKALMNIQMSN